MKTISISYQVENPHSFPIQLWLSIPNEKTFGSPIQITQNHDPQYSFPPDFHGNQFAYYFLASGEKLDFTYQYQAKRERSTSLSAAERSYYLRSTALTPLESTLQNKAEEITKDAQTDREQAFRLFDYMTKQYRFSLLHELKNYDEYEALPNGSHYLFQEQAGDSRDFACLYASFCRSIGIPCRVIFGSFVIPQYKEHVWNEVYINGEGWIPVDTCMGRIQRKQWWLSFLSDCKTLYYKRYFGKLEDVRPVFAIDPDLSRHPRAELENYHPEQAEKIMQPFSWGKASYDHVIYFPPLISEDVEEEQTMGNRWEDIFRRYVEDNNFTARVGDKPFPGEWMVDFPAWKLTLYQFKNFLFVLMLLITLPLLFAKVTIFQNELPFAFELIRHTTHLGVSACFLLLGIRWIIFAPMAFISLSNLIFIYLEQG